MYCLKFFAIAALGLVHMAAAQSTVLYFTSVVTEASVGLPVAITYKAPNNDPATIVLRQGDPANLATISTLTTSATNGTYTWIPAATLPPATDYALQILQDGEVNYSAGFTLQASNYTLVNGTTTALTTVPCTVSGNATVYPYGSGLVTASGNPGGQIANATFVSPTLTAINTAGPATVTSTAVTTPESGSSSSEASAAAATGAAVALGGNAFATVLGVVGVSFALL